MSRLLAIILVLGLFAPSLTADAHAHAPGPGGAHMVTVEAPDVVPGAASDHACLACHVHCGCHIAVSQAESGKTIIKPAVTTLAMLASERGRVSALAAPPIRPPRS